MLVCNYVLESLYILYVSVSNCVFYLSLLLAVINFGSQCFNNCNLNTYTVLIRNISCTFPIHSLPFELYGISIIKEILSLRSVQENIYLSKLYFLSITFKVICTITISNTKPLSRIILIIHPLQLAQSFFRIKIIITRSSACKSIFNFTNDE